MKGRHKKTRYRPTRKPPSKSRLKPIITQILIRGVWALLPFFLQHEPAIADWITHLFRTMKDDDH